MGEGKETGTEFGVGPLSADPLHVGGGAGFGKNS